MVIADSLNILNITGRTAVKRCPSLLYERRYFKCVNYS